MTLLNGAADLLQSRQSLDGRGISPQLGAKGTRRSQGLVLSSAYDELCLFLFMLCPCVWPFYTDRVLLVPFCQVLESSSYFQVKRERLS